MRRTSLVTRLVTLLFEGARPADPMAAAFGDLARELTPAAPPSVPQSRPVVVAASAPRQAA